jgi:photosynthetic reaction center cytochrome c subunit
MDWKRGVLLSLLAFPVLGIVVSLGRGQSRNNPLVHPDLVHPDAIIPAHLSGFTVVPQAVSQGSSQAASPLPSEPAGANRCQFCHPSEVEGYARSAMAHSLRRAGQEPDGTVQTPDAKITAHTSPTGYWQSLESGGETTNYRIDYVIGSGNHAAGYLLDVAGHLFQSPVAYYKSRQAYDLAPGYEGLPNPDFTRPIAEACLFCHSGTALKISGTANEYRSPPFSAEAITCERCHGSAEKHLNDPRAGTIINPAKLEPAARDSICEQCHLLGVGRVLNPGKGFSDFRPGEPLEDVFTTYRNVSPPGADAGKFKVISHVEQLARSTCSRMSNGKLWCGTCHDPHDKPVDPVAFFRSKCLSCHTQNFATSHPDKQSNCISCHMPRRDARDGGHTAFTDHRIQRRPEPEEALPAETDIAAWREPAPDVQKRNLGIAYINVGLERRSPPFIGRGYRMLTEVQQQFAGDDGIFTAMGSALLVAKQTSEAELAFERALQLHPDSVTGETNAASAYLQAGDQNRAIAHLERAVALDPLHLAADAPLIELYKQQGEAEKAAELSSKVSAALSANGTEQQPAGNAGTDKTSAPSSQANSDKTAESAFKNIQVLKSISPDQLIPAMQFITASLGVKCNYCHVQDHFEKDDKKPKQIARDMMRMMFAIDKDNFAGNREVTCYSCHRGSIKPAGTPLVASEAGAQNDEQQNPALIPERLAFNLPTADELIRGYIQALGGAAAIEHITSRIEKGTTTIAGKTFATEIYDQYPGKQTVIRHTPLGDSGTVFDGQRGWFGSGLSRELHGADLDAARMDADLHFPLHIKQICAELRVEYPEKIGEREAYAISCLNAGKTPVKLYFDEHSGLLMRVVRYAASPFGLVPTQIDYDDYRDAGGVKLPFRWTVARPDGRATTQLEQIELNVPIDNTRFAKPASAAASSR